MSGTLTDLKKSLEFNGHLTDILGVLKEIAMAAYWSLEKSKDRFELFWRIRIALGTGQGMESHPSRLEGFPQPIAERRR